MTTEAPAFTEPNWDDLAASATTVEDIHVDPAPITSDDKKIAICEQCGLPIDSYKGKGRKPRFHPEHRPSATGQDAAPKTSTRTGKTKAEREADAIAEEFRSKLNVLALFVGATDPFDGLALVTGGKHVTGQLRGVLVSHDEWRNALQGASASGSVLGLVVVTLATIVVPILAHHGVIPSFVNGKPVGELLVKIPSSLRNLEKKMAGAEDALADALKNVEDIPNPTVMEDAGTA